MLIYSCHNLTDCTASITSRIYFCVDYLFCDIFLSSIYLKTSNPVESFEYHRNTSPSLKKIPSAERTEAPGEERKLESFETCY